MIDLLIIGGVVLLLVGLIVLFGQRLAREIEREEAAKEARIRAAAVAACQREEARRRAQIHTTVVTAWERWVAEHTAVGTEATDGRP